MIVMKFGGTSVGSAERIKAVADLVTAEKNPVFVVLSAMSGTTNTLEEIASLMMRKENEEASKLIDKLWIKYSKELIELFPSSEERLLPTQAVEKSFQLLRNLNKIENFTLYEEKRVLAQGELMSTSMMLYHLLGRGEKAVIIPALDFMRTDTNAEPDLKQIRKNLKPLLNEAPQNTHIYITEGYICRTAYGEVDNLHRGGSDYTASLVGAAIESEEIQIWTDIDGMHNNDPRFVDRTTPVRKLNFEEASELAYFGAKILHPTCIQPAKEYGIPVRLLNTMDPKAEGTIISFDSEKGCIKAVAAKDNMIVLGLKSRNHILPWHFLSRLMSSFEAFRLPIDLITTSGTTVSLAIEKTDALNNLITELDKLGEISVDENMTIICVAGDLGWDNVGFESKIFSAMKTIPMRMISYGSSNYNITFVIETSAKKNALSVLSDELFNQSSLNESPNENK